MAVESDFLVDGKWTCTQCGSCCSNPDMMKDLPHLDRGDGICMHLTSNNKCSIYDIRPYACRTENFPASDSLRARSCAYLSNTRNQLINVT